MKKSTMYIIEIEFIEAGYRDDEIFIANSLNKVVNLYKQCWLKYFSHLTVKNKQIYRLIRTKSSFIKKEVKIKI